MPKYKKCSSSRRLAGSIAGGGWLTLCVLLSLVPRIAANQTQAAQASPPKANPQPAFALEDWKNRFHEQRRVLEANAADVVDRMIVLEGRVLLDEAGNDAAGFARKCASQDLPAEVILLEIASIYSRVGQLDRGLKTADLIGNNVMRTTALSSVAHMRLNRNDIAAAMAVAQRLDERRRDSLLNSIVTKQIELRDFDAARATLAMLQNAETRNKLAKTVDREAGRPQPGEADFVRRNVAWTRKYLEEQNAEAAELRELLGQDAPEVSREQQENMSLLVSKARLAHHQGDADNCLRNLRLCLDASKALNDRELRMPELLTLACLSSQFDQKPLAREILLDTTRDPESDDYQLWLTVRGLNLMEAIANALSDEEIGVLVDRWKADEFPTELMALATAFAKRGEFGRLDSLYRRLDTAKGRLLVCNIAIEHLRNRQK
jgi:hypothetical protein